jgi:hypothetical protein
LIVTLNDKKIKPILTCIYLIGIGCVRYYGILYLKHSTTIPNPEAMLLMMQYEVGAWTLMIGLPFMIASCISVILIYKTKTVLHKILLLLPAIIDIILVVNYWIMEI